MPVHNADALRAQMDPIDQLNDELEDIRLLKSIEVDFLEDGSLDLSNEVLNTSPWEDVEPLFDC